jgi:DNA-binding response OmpR family regulator
MDSPGWKGYPESMDTNDSLNTALVVAGDEAVLPAVTSMLEKAGFAVLSAPGAKAALDRVRNEKTPIDLAVIDVAAAGMKPADIIRELNDISPRVRILFLCDEDSDTPRDSIVAGSVRRCLRKPFRRSKFLGKVLEMMDRPKVLTA